MMARGPAARHHQDQDERGEGGAQIHRERDPDADPFDDEPGRRGPDDEGGRVRAVADAERGAGPPSEALRDPRLEGGPERGPAGRLDELADDQPDHARGDEIGGGRRAHGEG